MSHARAGTDGYTARILENDQIVLLEMQLAIRSDDDLRRTIPLQYLDAMTLFILEQVSHRGMGAHHDPLSV